MIARVIVSLAALLVSAAAVAAQVTVSPGTSWQVVATADASSSATIPFINLSGCRLLRITISNILPATDGAHFWLRTSTNNGSTYDSAASDYAYTSWQNTPASSFGTSSAGAAQILLGDTIGSAANRGVTQTIILYDFNQPQFGRLSMTGGRVDTSGNNVQMTLNAWRAQTTARNALQFQFSTGNIASGHFVVECMP